MYNKTFEKTAMDPALKKYLLAGLSSAVLAAGVGTTVSRLSSEKKRKKALDLNNNRNVITVDIDIPNFMKDLPTPAEFAATAVADKASKPTVSNATSDDIERLKKEIIRRNSGKLDFFRKTAEEAEVSNDVDEKKDKPEKDEPKEKKEDGGGVARLRDESGRFTSPTSPIAVKEEEKTANVITDWISDLTKPVVDPVVEFGSAVKDGIIDSPKLIAGGAAGIVLAAMLAKYINKKRAGSAKAKLDSQRDAYVEQLQGVQKSAQDGVGHALGLGAGVTFLAPFALTSILAYKVMKNRSEQQEKSRRINGSFPTQPIITYRTRGDVEKSAAPQKTLPQMIDGAIDYATDAARKGLGIATDATLKGLGKIVDATGIGVDSGVDKFMEMLGRPENKKRLASFAKAISSGNEDSVRNATFELMSPSDMVNIPVYASASFKKKLLQNKKFQDMIINMLDDSQYADSFGKIRDEAISKEVGKYVGYNNDFNRILSDIVRYSGTWKPGVRQRMMEMSGRY